MKREVIITPFSPLSPRLNITTISKKKNFSGKKLILKRFPTIKNLAMKKAMKLIGGILKDKPGQFKFS